MSRVKKLEVTLLFSHYLFISVKRKWAECTKIHVEFPEEKAQITVSCRDLELMRDMDSLYLLQFSCDQVSSAGTRFLAASLICGRDLNYGRDLLGSAVLKC